MRLSLAAAPLWCGLIGCARETVLVDLEPGEVMLVAAVDPQGAVSAAELWRGDGLLFRAPPEGTVLGFRFLESALVDASGVQLDAEALSVHTDPEGIGGCGRCLSRSAVGPQVLRPGESCPPPAFASTETLFGDEVANASASVVRDVRLARAGQCACAEPLSAIPPETRDFEVQPVAPDGGAWPLQTLTVTASGAVGLFGEHAAQVSTVDGRQLARLAGPNVFSGPVLAAAPMPDGGFVVVAHDSSVDLLEQEVIRFSPTLDTRTTVPLPFRAEAVAQVPGTDFHVFGGHVVSSAGERFQLMACRSDQDPLKCSDLTPAELDGSISAFAFSPSGALAASLFFFRFVIFEGVFPPEDVNRIEALSDTHGTLSANGGARWRWRIVDLPTPYAGQPGAWRMTDDAIYVCSGNAERPIALTLDDDLYDGRGAPRWVELSSVATNCGGVTPEPDGTSVRIHQANADLVCTSPQACVEAPPRPEDEGGFRRIGGLDLRNHSTQVWAREPGASSWTRVYGHPAPYRPIRALVTRDDVVYAFHAQGEVSILSSDFRALSAAPITGLSSLYAAAYEPASDSFFVATTCDSPAAPELQIARMPGGELTAVDLFEDQPVCDPIIRLEAAAPGRVLAATESGRLHVLWSDGHAERVDLNWDDPETPEEEEAPGQLRWMNLSSVLGVGLASGDDGAIFRVDVFSKPPIAQRIYLARPTQKAWVPELQAKAPAMGGIAATCPDDGAVIAKGVQRTNFETGLAWTFHPEPEAFEAGFAPVEFTDSDVNGFAKSSKVGLSALYPVGLVAADPSFYLAVFERSFHRIGASWRFRLDGIGISDVLMLDDGRILISSTGGDIFLLERN